MNDLINLNLIYTDQPLTFNATTYHYKGNRYIFLFHYSEICGTASCFLDFVDGKFYHVKGSTYHFGETGFIDPRVIKYNNEYFISDTNFEKEFNSMHLRKLAVYDDVIYIDNSHILDFPTILNFPNYTLRHEKNWTPFDHEGKFYYVYSLNPHRILELDVYGTGLATLKYETSWITNTWWANQNWEKPYYRLNTSPILLPDGTYLSMFHTMNFSKMDSKVNQNIPGNWRSYWTGFYQFEGSPPFRVKKISPFPVIWADDELPNSWPKQSQRTTANPFFPFNLFLYEDNVVITGGTNDVGAAYCLVNLEKILQSLVCV